MSRYVVDTSAYSNFKRGDPQVVDLIDSADWIGMPSIVLVSQGQISAVTCLR